MDTETESVVDKFVSMVVHKFEIDKIILFGSRARGDYNENSDFDFFVVMETSKEEMEQGLEIRKSLGNFDHSLDLLLVTPKHFQEGFLLKDVILEDGVTIYER